VLYDNLKKLKALRLDFLIALIFIVWLSASLVRVENQRYAMQIGMCEDKVLYEKVQQIGWDYACLSKVETRTSWLWHLFYGLMN
jgi:hypothetical protein